MKPALGLAATGVIAILLGKFLLALLLPFIGLAIAFLFMAAKLVLIGGLVFVAIWLVRRSNRREETVG